MGTDNVSECEEALAGLGASDWSSVLEAIALTEAWLRDATPGDPHIKMAVLRLTGLASHAKWEVRRALANLAAQFAHPAFESTVAKLASDENSRVKQAAERAALRRRDWRNASTLGKQHEDHLNTVLKDIELRYGLKARDAVKRAGETIADVFARELYHEVVKLLTPLALSAERLQSLLTDEGTTRDALVAEATLIEQRTARIRSVLEAMRAYTAQPKLVHKMESLKAILDEAALLIVDGQSRVPHVPIVVRASDSDEAEVSRARLIQAITNILTNAVESYRDIDKITPIEVGATVVDGSVEISIADCGCGMSGEVLADAIRLFATNKPDGTGVGLPLAVKIVESEHNGRLHLQSKKNIGTTVRVVMPQHRVGSI